MKLYRYYCESSDNYPEEGFLNRLGNIRRKIMDEDFDTSEDIILLVKEFDDNLPYPDNEITSEFMDKNIPMRCFFTEYGNAKFKDTIDKCVKYLLENYNTITNCRIISIAENSDRILYRDRYQVVLSI